MVARQAAGRQQRGMLEVDEDPALAALELAWANSGYHGFSAASAGSSSTSSIPRCCLPAACLATITASSLACGGVSNWYHQ